MMKVRVLAVDFGGTLARPGPSPDGRMVADVLRGLPGSVVTERFSATFDDVNGRLRHADRARGRQTAYAEVLSQTAAECGSVLPDDLDAVVEAVFTAVPDAEVDVGAAHALRLLRGRGLRCLLACDTQRPRAVRRETLRAAGILDCFDALVLSSDVGVRKPHPTFYAAVVKAAGCQAEGILFVGDTPEKDVVAPRTYGMRSVLIAKDRPLGLDASIDVIEHFSRLPAYLEAISAR